MQILPEHKAYWQQKQKQIAQETQQRTQQAYAVLDEIVAVLVHNYGANRVLLFGSLVRGKFGLESDIDLAVEGIAKQDFFAAMGKINLMTDFWVDLKPFEDLQPHFRERILEYGKWIYGEPIAK